MTTTFKWTAPESTVTYFTTELNGATMTNTTFSALGAALDNDADLYPYIDVELYLAALSPTAGAFCDVWIISSLDGTNYPAGGKPLQTSYLLCSLQMDVTASTAQRLIKANILIPPLKFKMQVRNMSGVAFATSGNTLKYRRHYDQGV